MAGKILKRLMIIVLITACLFNIVNKLVKRNSYEAELEAAAHYVETISNDVSDRVEDNNK